MLIGEVVACSQVVAATRSRLTKTAALAELLSRAEAEEIGPLAAMLVGEPRQGRIGVGWAAMSGTEATMAATIANLTVRDVDETFTALAACTGPGSVERRQALLDDLFSRATADEQRFLRKLFLGDLRQGALEGIVVDAIAKAGGIRLDAVRRALMLGGDLGETAALALIGGADALSSVRLRVLRPVRPMLASTAEGLSDAIASVGRASVEWKLDGARIQVHRDGSDVRVFTRNLNDVTARLSEVVDTVLSFECSAVVLDGETLSLDEDGRPRAFQQTMSQFGSDPAPAAAHHSGLAPFFFDLLHLDGRDLVDEPLETRLALLDQLVGARRIPGIVTESASQAQSVFDEAMRLGHEGVMVKAAMSSYEAGRRGKSWLKVKPVRTFDLVVLGAEWGHGRRRGWLSNLHLGARDPAEPGRFVMVGKTFKGLTDAVLQWQTEAILSREQSREGITVFARPELVVEIDLDGVQASRRYPGGVALRFARVVRYRDDKLADGADTIDDLRALLIGSEEPVGTDGS